MTKMKSVKRALFSSLVSLVLSCSMLVGTTFAWFTDSVESATNQIVAGNLDVELYHADKGTNGADEKVTNTTKLFDDVSSNLWEPGATAWEKFTIANEGTLALKYQFALNVTDATVVNGVPFTKMLRATIVDETFDYTRANIEAIAEDEWSDLASFTRPGNLAADAKETFGVIIRWAPTDHDNDFNMNNGKTGGPVSVKVGAKLVATQFTAEVDGNGSDYDKDAWADGMKVVSGEDLQAAINNGVQNIVLENNIVLTNGPIVIPASTSSVSTMSTKRSSDAIVLNLNGHEIIGKVGRDANNQRIHTIINHGNLVIMNGTVASNGANGGSAVYNDAGASLTLEKNVTILGAPFADGSWPSYAVNNYGELTVNGTTIKSYHGGIATCGEGVTVVNDAYIDVGQSTTTKQTSWVLYAIDDASVTVYDGVFENTKDEQGKVYGGGYICPTSTKPFVVYGGTFNKTEGDNNGSGIYYKPTNLEIRGGTFDTTIKEEYLADGYRAEDKNGDGSYEVYFPQDSLEDLFKPEEGEETPTEINVPAGNFTFPADKLEAGMTVECAEGTVFEGTSSLNVKGATVVGATFDGDNKSAVSGTIDGTFKNCVFDGYNGLRMCYAGETVVFEDCIFTGDLYGAHFDGGANEVIFRRCTFSGFNAFGAAIEKLTMEDCTFKANGRSGYNGINMWGNTEMTGCTFVFDGSAVEWIDLCNANKTAEFTNCVVTDGTNVKNFKEEVSKRESTGTVIVDGVAVVHNAANLAFAVANGATNLWLQAGGEYTMPQDDILQGKKVTVSGKREANLDISEVVTNGSQAFYNTDLVFEGITITCAKENYKGFTHANTLTYKNCKLNGLQFLFAKTANFEYCDLDSNGAEHCVWTYGAQEVNFTNCNFTYGDRAVNCYSDDDIAGGKQTVNFTKCTFTSTNELSDGAVEINSVKFSVGIVVNMEDCTAPAYGQLAYVSKWDSNNGAKTTIIVDGVVIADTAEQLKVALSSEEKNVKIYLVKNISIDIGTGWKMGGTETESITIDGNGKTLTLSSTYRSYFNLANAEGKLYLNNMTLTNMHAGTHFFDYTTHFNCDVVAKEVTFAKSPLVGSGVTATFTDCVFNQAGNDIYGLWIMSGSNVTVNGGELNTDRGFKIADEDSAAESTVLNVSETKFNNNKKAAILVTTKHGATITVENVDISNCKADSTNAVWIDKDRTAYADTIKVTGANCINEP